MKKIDETLYKAHLIFQAMTSNQQLADILSKKGYDEAGVQEGKACYDEVVRLVQMRNGIIRASIDTSRSFEDDWKGAREYHSLDAQNTRWALRDYPEFYPMLGLDGPRKRDFMGWYRQTSKLYQVLKESAELRARVASAGVTMDRIDGGNGMLPGLLSSYEQQRAYKSGTVNARRQRDEAVAALSAWVSTFNFVARRALAKMPELLALLELNPSPRKKKVRQPVAEPTPAPSQP